MKFNEWRLYLLYGKSAFDTSFDRTDDVYFSSPYCLFPCSSVASILIFIMPIATTVLHYMVKMPACKMRRNPHRIKPVCFFGEV